MKHILLIITIVLLGSCTKKTYNTTNVQAAPDSTTFTKLPATSIDGYTVTLSSNRNIFFGDPAKNINRINVDLTAAVIGKKVQLITNCIDGDEVFIISGTDVEPYMRTGHGVLMPDGCHITASNANFAYITIEYLGAEDIVIDFKNDL